MPTNQELEKRIIKLEKQKEALNFLLEGLIIAIKRPALMPDKYRRKWDNLRIPLTN